MGGTTHKAKDGEGDIARAILLHMWMEAKRQWQAHVALPTPSPPTTTTSTTSSTTDEKPPKHFTSWAQCVESYNAKLLDGKRRKFPTNMLVGAEEVLARLCHEHTKSKLYTPLGLGEILSRRTFTPDKAMNPLAQFRAANAAGGVRYAWTEASWWPGDPMMAIMDGADAAKWALILVKHRDRGGRRTVRRVVQSQTKVSSQRLAAGARLLVRVCLEDRTGNAIGDGVFREVTRDIMADVTSFQEAVLSPWHAPSPQARVDASRSATTRTRRQNARTRASL